MLNVQRVLWALRKIMLPIKSSDLVLDVGSGGNPYPRSDILLDRLTGSEHRCGEAMMIDRPVIFGDASRMPFKDKAFDFVIASHILEHMADPEVFLKELQRVGKAGYIETPNAIYERFDPFDIHCLEIIKSNDVLHIHKKSKPVEDDFLGTKGVFSEGGGWRNHLLAFPPLFHIRHIWSNEIKYEINNPDISCKWIEAINEESSVGEAKESYLADERGWRDWGLAVLNRWNSFWRYRRLKNFNILNILACPSCGGELESEKNILSCLGCNAEYAYHENIPDFTRNLAPIKDPI